jgi:hypothetical protein
MAESVTQQGSTGFARWFQHLPQYRIVVCIDCRTAVVPDHIAAHLRRNHASVSKEEQRQAQSYVGDLENVARDVSDVRFPQPEDPPCSAIPIKQDGLRCTWVEENRRQCEYVVGSQQMVQAHCRTAHGWTNEQKRGGNAKQKSKHTPNRMWQEG